MQQLMAALIGHHDTLFPRDEDSPGALESCNNNNDPLKRTAGQLQNRENNNTASVRQCTWEAPDSPGRVSLDNSSPRSGSPRNAPTMPRFEVSQSPPMTVKKNPAFIKGSGIVTNGSFSSSSSSSSAEEKNPTLVGMGTLQMRRTGALKSPGTKMGVQNGSMRMGVCSTDIVNGTLNSRNGLWSPLGGVTMREIKGRDAEQQQNRLSTYDNVHVQQTPCPPCMGNSCEDKQSVDSATWSTSSCEISLPDISASCRSSTTTCPEQDFTFEDPLLDEGERRTANANANANSGGRGSRGTSSSENSEVTYPVSGHSALHSLVASLKQEMLKQKSEYETRVKR